MCFVLLFVLQERDIISFPVEMATIEAKLAERGQQLHPIPLDNTKAPQGRGAGHVWTDCNAIVYTAVHWENPCLVLLVKLWTILNPLVSYSIII